MPEESRRYIITIVKQEGRKKEKKAPTKARVIIHDAIAKPMQALASIAALEIPHPPRMSIYSEVTVPVNEAKKVAK